ncbi:hypothetical protein EYF80_044926 [Liparis tanakae]|uniref:Uncharacterized protein n=1 Tax=Liparis tanakae TaxID=230148 RepID=A0A4Z2FUH4_9TELE|nr:hypothetical protein EYF80_044926 [Liparis tanakae]
MAVFLAWRRFHEGELERKSSGNTRSNTPGIHSGDSGVNARPKRTVCRWFGKQQQQQHEEGVSVSTGHHGDGEQERETTWRRERSFSLEDQRNTGGWSVRCIACEDEAFRRPVAAVLPGNTPRSVGASSGALEVNALGA